MVTTVRHVSLSEAASSDLTQLFQSCELAVPAISVSMYAWKANKDALEWLNGQIAKVSMIPIYLEAPALTVCLFCTKPVCLLVVILQKPEGYIGQQSVSEENAPGNTDN